MSCFEQDLLQIDQEQACLLSRGILGGGVEQGIMGILG